MTPRWLPYALIAPATFFLAAFFVVPLVQTIVLSFDGGTAGPLGNYRRMLGDLNFSVSIANTFLLVAVVVPLQVVLALAMGLMLQKLQRGREIVLWIWTIPLGISDLAAGLVWLAILQNTGYLNSLLFQLGVIEGPTAWLNAETPMTLFLGIVAAEVWRATAVVLVILVSGMQLVPKEYGEAADVFGATPVAKFFRVTLPLLKPSLQSALILRTVLAFEVFAAVYALGGRNFPVLVGEAYTWQHVNQNYGVAAAYAVLVMLISLASTVLYLRVLRVRPEQQA
ncbi:MAG: sugar ABC transporter permease [Alphaproteobacteria bacterium]|nr:sugar ABC transporter permease [Alphaproteobacteria bacterium]